MHTPLPVKLLKVLISDLRSQLESEDENEYDLEVMNSSIIKSFNFV